MKNLMTLFAVVFAFAAVSCVDNKQNNEPETEEVAQVEEAEIEVKDLQTPTIVGVAAANENFSTLVTAVKAAGLVETLNSDGPFTVFAPTNDAFGKLPEGTVATLVKPENKEKLTGILTYHVVAGKLMAADVVKAIQENNGSFSVTTVQGNKLTASLSGDKVILTDMAGNAAEVVITDVAASNGVIHAIDTVVMPSK
ncbi:fasciclin domain-containing protein [Croceiramulus getboli]|nr:fasciclin domain-containing protein [Flavobacteriaceae bacterium YJPT1-3]